MREFKDNLKARKITSSTNAKEEEEEKIFCTFFGVSSEEKKQASHVLFQSGTKIFV